ncbi:tetratricopeptide repeat protein [Asticcacaulis sp. SL142]|uniref:tetratricopeptide repeat protein n=1 Tax=Asticcacaulis sp. SL142 TaxID=2995155 RepID=UPI00226D2452|nr:tetratricopeptide repeat protein [Asticcacaulis sp. SL142]WAC49200.1 tetratricopeptide repeat protein [Asticcacaulis sp. SL142]
MTSHIGGDDAGLSLQLRAGNAIYRYVGAANSVSALGPLPLDLDFEAVDQRAGTYKDFLRSFTVASSGSQNDNAYERFVALLGEAANRPCGWMISSDTATIGSYNPLVLPWELILFENIGPPLDQIAVVRSLNRTTNYSPSTLDDPMRTLVVQGGQLSSGDLEFGKEEAAFGKAWDSLGPGGKSRIQQPEFRRINACDLGQVLDEVKPHLLCFSGHGRTTGSGFEFRFNDDWVPVAHIARCVSRLAPLPILAAFWTCEGLAVVDAAEARATNQNLPSLVEAMVGIGIEGVLGCQTRVKDTCSRVLARTLFRHMAEGQGPARALAAARAELANASNNVTPAAEAEWPSPVLWVGGASMPRLNWARPEGEDLAVLIDKLSYESIAETENAGAVWDEAPDVAAHQPHWFDGQPCWIRHQTLSHDHFEVLKTLRQAAKTDGRPLLILTVPGADSNDFLRAFAANMRDLRARIFPGARLSETTWLTSIFALAKREDRRLEAWMQLTGRHDLTIAVIAKGGLSDTTHLTEAAERGSRIIVISPDLPSQDEIQGGLWQQDSYVTTPVVLPEGTELVLKSLAVFNRALSKSQIDAFSKPLGLENAHSKLRAVLIGAGGRFAVAASLAFDLQNALSEDERTQAHRHCLAFLEGTGFDPLWTGAPYLEKCSIHALGAGDNETAQRYASEAIEAWSRSGKANRVVAMYKTMRRHCLHLDFGRLQQVSRAQLALGYPRRAEDVLSRVIPASLSSYEEVEFALLHAETLRNQPDTAKHDEALRWMESALPIAESNAQVAPDDPLATLQPLIVAHDIARHGVYFQKKAAVAKAEYERIIAACDELDERQYLKATALRNLADVCHRYAYDVESDPAAALEHLKAALEVMANTPPARRFIAETTYELSKALDRMGQTEAGVAYLDQALRIARSDGNALVLALASNRRFWKDQEDKAPFDETVFAIWAAIESQLEAVENHSWAARALVNSRLRLVKGLPDGMRSEAVTVMRKTQTSLMHSDGLTDGSDIGDRWLPVLAGLEILGEPGPGEDFRARLSTIAAAREMDISKLDMGSVWEGIR